MSWALQQPDLTPSQKLVLLGIANHDGDGGAWPSVATLARYACVKRRRVQQILGELEQLGLITRVIQKGGTGLITRDELRPNLYLIHRPGSFHRLSTPGATQCTPPGATQCTPGVQHSAPKPSLEPVRGTGNSTSSAGCAHRYVSADTGECASCGAGGLGDAVA